MRKLMLGLSVALVVAGQALGQSAIIRGESSPGVYENLQSISQRLQVDAAISSGGSAVPPQVSTVTSTVTTVTNSASVQILAANTSRKLLMIQNNDPTGDVYINFGSTQAFTTSTRIRSGATLYINSSVPTTAIQALGSIASNANVVTTQGQ